MCAGLAAQALLGVCSLQLASLWRRHVDVCRNTGRILWYDTRTFYISSKNVRGFPDFCCCHLCTRSDASFAALQWHGCREMEAGTHMLLSLF